MTWLMWWWWSVVPVCWPPPVVGSVTEPFRAPACAYCAGHRGVTFASAAGEPVTAVAGGVVRFSGQVAGLRWVVEQLDDGTLASYGQLRFVSVVAGQRISEAQPIGLAGQHVYFGLRRHGVPIDPTPRLGRWRTAPRLVPVDGSPPRPGGNRRLTCGARHRSR